MKISCFAPISKVQTLGASGWVASLYFNRLQNLDNTSINTHDNKPGSAELGNNKFLMSLTIPHYQASWFSNGATEDMRFKYRGYFYNLAGFTCEPADNHKETKLLFSDFKLI